MSQPTIFLSNWSSHHRPGHHGPGRKVSGMALPRSWEVGDGICDVVAPDPDLLRRVKAGEMAIREYLLAYGARLTTRAERLRPGLLAFDAVAPRGRALVADGDSILCSCAAPATAALAMILPIPDLSRHPCHLEVLAPALSLAGWAVHLYGATLEVRGGTVYRVASGRPYTWEPL